MDQSDRRPDRANPVLCLIQNAVLREDLGEALMSQGFRAATRFDRAQSYCAVILDIDDANPRQLNTVRGLGEAGVPVILIGDSIETARESGLPCVAFFTMAFVTDLLVARLRALLEAPPDQRFSVK